MSAAQAFYHLRRRDDHETIVLLVGAIVTAITVGTAIVAFIAA